MHLSDLRVGADVCNRCSLSPFRSRTSRNQPSNAKYIFRLSVWMRFLIQPAVGWGLAYLDFEQQEFGIGAAALVTRLCWMLTSLETPICGSRSKRKRFQPGQPKDSRNSSQQVKDLRTECAVRYGRKSLRAAHWPAPSARPQTS
jgi:hypothetical protein